MLFRSKFGDPVVAKFINSLMYEGKKSVAERIVYTAFDRIQKRSGQEPLRVTTPAGTREIDASDGIVMPGMIGAIMRPA